jgi:hypothetical protein
VEVQKIRWEMGSNEPEDDHTLFYGKWNKNHHLMNGFFTHKIIRSTVKIV